jgi:hypothetical protein
MLANLGEIRALGLKWFHSNVYVHRELGRRFTLHGVPTWFFFHRGRRLAGRPASTASGSSKRR